MIGIRHEALGIREVKNLLVFTNAHGLIPNACAGGAYG